MPFQPAEGQEFNGQGLGIHFFLGNLICMHPGLLECWFGWRVKSIFSGPEALAAYCRGDRHLASFQELARQEQVRFWLEGEYQQAGEKIHVGMTLHDMEGSEVRLAISMAFTHGLQEFRTLFFDWVETWDLPFFGLEKALWPEKISPRGLDCLGRALEATYLNYIQGPDLDPEPLDLTWFVRAGEISPDSYLAQDLLGWGVCKNREYQKAMAAFRSALALNPHGLGALSGMMWCGIYTQDRQMALEYALAKAGARGEDPEKARAFVDKKLPLLD